MVGVGYQDEALGFGCAVEDLGELFGRGKLVAGSAEKQLGKSALLEQFVGVSAVVGDDWRAEGDQGFDAGVRDRRSKADGGSERESGKDDGQRKSLGKVIERNLHVGDFSATVIVLSGACAYATEVEAQYRKAEGVQGLHGVEDDLVVHGAAEERVRVADDACVFCVGSTEIQEGFKPSGFALQKKRFDAAVLVRGHARAFSLMESSTATPVLPSREVSGRLEWQVASRSVCPLDRKRTNQLSPSSSRKRALAFCLELPSV